MLGAKFKERLPNSMLYFVEVLLEGVGYFPTIIILPLGIQPLQRAFEAIVFL